MGATEEITINDLPFGNEHAGWDIDDTGRVGISLFGNAVQVWSVMQGRSNVSVADVALAFNCTPEMVRAAVEEQPWMFICGHESDPSLQFIEHDGE